MTSGSLLLITTLLLAPPSGEQATPVVTPSKIPVGEPAIAPAHVDGEREAGPEPTVVQIEPSETEPAVDPPVVQEPEGTALPSWSDEPGTGPATNDGSNAGSNDGSNDGSDGNNDGADGTLPTNGTPIADWTTPVNVIPPEPTAPAKGWGLVSVGGALFGGMVVTQLITGLTCEDVYCGTRGWGWRLPALGVMAFAGGGGWVHGKRVAWDRAAAGQPSKNPIGRRAAGWTMFVLGFAALATDGALYQHCYDGKSGPYFQLERFHYTCSPVASIVTVDLATLVSASGLGLALSAESQLRNRRKFDLSVSPWGGRGQVGLSVGGRF